MLLRSRPLLIESVEKVRQIVSIIHDEIGLPSAFNDGRRVGFGIPHSPAIFEHSHFIARCAR